MWTKRKDEDYTSNTAYTPAAPAEPASEGIPMSTTPTRSADAERGSASIGKSVTIKGQIFSREDLIVDGEIEGSIELQEHRLTIGPNGKVSAGVKAREIVVLGSILGDVDAGDRIDIRKDARLVGNIKTSRIIIEDGAYFKGSIDIVKQDAPKVVPAPRPQTATANAGVTQPASVPGSPLR